MKPEIDNQVELCSLNSEDDPIEMVIEVEEIKQNDYFEALLIACGLSIAAFFGVFIRAGIQYYKIWRTETNYTVMYAQLIGCAILGFTSEHKQILFVKAKSRISRVFFFTITSGLCGSITTFSTWQFECNKNFLLQWDVSWGNYYGTYNGGRLIEWFICLFSGVALPMFALWFGRHLSQLSPYHNAKFTAQDSDPLILQENRFLEVLLVVCFLLSSTAVVVVPLYTDTTWIHFTYAAVFGAAGANLRYQLSHLNHIYPHFPIGTFLVNVSGSWFFAALMVLSIFYVDYYDTVQQAVLYGTTTGFLGCFTTVSTFVNELDSLAVADAYKYGFGSNLAAQLGIILIYDVYAYLQVTRNADADLSTAPINLCDRTAQLCDEFLNQTGCVAAFYNNTACLDHSDYSTYQGICQCGAFSTNRLTLLTIDSQVRSNFTASTVNVWPAHAEDILDPTQVVDVCLTFENLCDHYLNRIACPVKIRKIVGCQRRGILHADFKCTCGSHTEAGLRLQQVITDSLLGRRYDLTPYNGYATLDHIDFSSAYEDTCHAMLDHVQCPLSQRSVVGNRVAGDYDSWAGQCTCGKRYDANSVRVAKNIFNAVVRPSVVPLMVKAASYNTTRQWDICASYASICRFWMDKMRCPVNLQQIVPCGNGFTRNQTTVRSNSTYADTVMGMTSVCTCGRMDTLDSRQIEIAIDALSYETIFKEFWFIPPPSPPFNLLVGTNPFKQFLIPQSTLPQ